MAARTLDEKLHALRDFVGEKPAIKIDTFRNWSKTEHDVPVLSCRPETLSELTAVVKGCRQLAIRVRAAGATHSWTPLFSDEGDLVMYTADLKRHDGPQIELIQNTQDSCDKHVTVMTNVTMGQLMEFEVFHGVCLPCNVVLRVVTCGGVVSTACHGVGADCECISDYICSMRIVDSDGILRTFSVKEDGDDVMKAVKANFGLFGIIYDMTFRIENLIIVRTQNIFETVDRVFYDKDYMKELFAKNWSVEIFWFPFNSMECGELTEAVFERKVDWGDWEPRQDKVWVRLVNKAETVGDVEPAEVYHVEGIREKIEHVLGHAVDELITNFTSLTPYFTRSFEKALCRQKKDKTLIQQLPHAVHYRDGVEKMPVLDMEFAVDFDAELNNFASATQFVIERVKAEAAKGRFPLNIVMEMRVMGHSNLYMSPALAGSPKTGGSGQTLYVEVLSLCKTPGWEEFSSEVAQRWMQLDGARPHWAKQWTYIEGIDEYLQKVYKKEFIKFREQIHDSHADPHGIFLNSCLQKLLYPNGHAGWEQLLKEREERDKEKPVATPTAKGCCGGVFGCFK